MAHSEQTKLRGGVSNSNIFRREGHYWTLAYGGTLVRLRDSKGLRDIARLIECVGTTLRVSELKQSPDGAAERSSADHIERARVAVTMRIRNALGRIEKEHHALGRHLSRAIKTGSFCSYDPESATNWTL